MTFQKASGGLNPSTGSGVILAMLVALRINILLFSILVVVASGLGSARAFYLFQGFERESLEPSDLSFTGPVGIVEFREGNHVFRCTGALVSEDLVLTNAHCLLGDQDGLKSKLTSLSFYPNVDRFSVRKRGGLGTRYKADPNEKVWLGKKLVSDHSIPSDWAFFRLRRPVTKTDENVLSHFDVFMIDGPTAAELFGTALETVSYNGNIDRTKLEIVRKCVAQKEKNWKDQIFNTVDMLVHSCSGKKGSSGAGILVKIGGKRKLVALHVGGQYAENPKESLSKAELEEIREGNDPIPFDDYRFNVGAPSLTFYPTLRQLIGKRADSLQRQQRRDIQARLNDLGFNVGSVDGIFGKKTRAAINVFQQSTGSLPTGRLTTEQHELLFSNEFRVFAAGKTSKTVFEGRSDSLQEAVDSALALCIEERPDCRVVASLSKSQCFVLFWGLPVHRTIIFDQSEKSDLSLRMLMSGTSSYIERRLLYQNCWSPEERTAFIDPFSGPH